MIQVKANIQLRKKWQNSWKTLSSTISIENKFFENRIGTWFGLKRMWNDVSLVKCNECRNGPCFWCISSAHLLTWMLFRIRFLSLNSKTKKKIIIKAHHLSACSIWNWIRWHWLKWKRNNYLKIVYQMCHSRRWSPDFLFFIHAVHFHNHGYEMYDCN